MYVYIRHALLVFYELMCWILFPSVSSWVWGSLLFYKRPVRQYSGTDTAATWRNWAWVPLYMQTQRSTTEVSKPQLARKSKWGPEVAVWIGVASYMGVYTKWWHHVNGSRELSLQPVGGQMTSLVPLNTSAFEGVLITTLIAWGDMRDPTVQKYLMHLYASLAQETSSLQNKAREHDSNSDLSPVNWSRS